MINYKLGQLRAFDSKINFVEVNNLESAFLNLDNNVYVKFAPGECNFLVAFDETKISNERILELVTELYNPFDNPHKDGFEEYFEFGEGYKIPYDSIDYLLEKIRIRFFYNNSQVPLSTLNAAFKSSDMYLLIPHADERIFDIVFQSQNSDEKNHVCNVEALDAISFLENMNNRAASFHSYFDTVTAIVDDLKNHGYDFEYDRFVSEDNTLEVRVRNRFHLHRWLEKRVMDGLKKKTNLKL